MHIIVQVSKHRYVVARAISVDGQANLNIYSNGNYGDKNEMFPVSSYQTITKPICYRDAMYCLASLYASGLLPEQFELQ